MADLKRALKRTIAAVARLRSRPGVGGRVLLYHSVTTSRIRDAGEMTVDVAMFERHLALLKESGYSVVGTAWMVDRLRQGREIPPRTVAITFDDGLADFPRLAAPLLAGSGYPSTLFVVAAALTERQASVRPGWPWGYLSVEEARDLIRSGGVEVGCHGLTHAPLGAMSPEALRQEVAGARTLLEDLLGSAVDLFAYPFGVRDMWDGRVRSAVREAGFRAAFTSVFGANQVPSDPYRLRRCRVSWRDRPGAFRDLLDGAYDWYADMQRLQLALSELFSVLRPL